MNQKAYSVLFCALLASTFVHELRAKGVAPVSSRLEVLERAASNEVCELQCSFDESININFGLSIEVVGNVLVIANLTANAALLIDASTQIVVALNGTSGGGVAIDISAKTGVYIKTGLWVASNTSLEVWIKSLSGGLKGLFSISGAVSFSLSSASTAILEFINNIVVKLVANISGELTANAKFGLQLILTIGGGLVVLLNGALKGLLTVIGSVVIKITNDLAGLFNLLQGVAAIIAKVGGSITALIEKGVTFNFEVILAASSGLEVLLQIILQISGKVDIGAALGSILNNVQSFFSLIAQLGGNSSVGISGVFLVVANIIGLINKNVTLEVVISSIIQFVALSSQQVTTDLTAALNGTLHGLVTVLERVNLSSQLGELLTTIKALISGKLVIGGVNISVIINKLLTGIISGQSNLLKVVAFVVLQLKAVRELSILVPYLLLILIFKLNSALGVSQLIALGIKINISAGAIAGGILKSILSGAASLVLSLVTGNLYDALSKLPVIGTVVTSLNAALEAAGSVSLKTYLNVASFVKSLILGFIQWATGIYLGVSSSVIAQVKAIFESSVSAGASISVNVTVSGSSSSSSNSSSSSSSNSSSSGSWSWGGIIG